MKSLSKISQKGSVIKKSSLLGGQCWATCSYNKKTSYKDGVAADTSWSQDPQNSIACPSAPVPPTQPVPNS